MRRLYLAATAFWLVTAGSIAAEGISLGLAKDDAWPSSEHIARMEAHGLTDHSTIYYKLNSPENLRNPFDWVRLNYLDADIPTVMTLIIDGGIESTVGTSEGTDVSAGIPGLLERVARGDFDEALQELARRIVADGRPLIIRPFHEIDGGWYQWGIYAEGNSAALAVEAVRHVIEVFDRAGASNVTWEINFNRRDGRGEVLGEAEYLIPALDALVDVYSVSTYNRCGTAPQYDEERSFAADFAPIYERIARLSKLPINVAEVSTSGACAPRIPWFTEMLTDIEDRFPRTEMVTFFFGVVPTGRASNDVPIYWGFEKSFLDLERFRELMIETRASFEDASVAPARSVTPPRRPARAQVVQSIRSVEVKPRPIESAPTSVQSPALVQSGPFGFDRMPWSLWSRFSLPLYEEGNPALNTVTGDPFGRAGPVLRFTATQRFLWDRGDFEHGPGIAISGALSGNDDQWWNNQISAGLTYGLYGDLPRGSVLWGGWSAEIFAGQREYFAPTPNRLDGGEGIIELRFGVNFGGDWLR